MNFSNKSKLVMLSVTCFLLLLSSSSTIAFEVGISEKRSNSTVNTTEVDTTQIKETDMYNYSSYLGGSQKDAGKHIATDKQGNYIVVGTTRSTDFPVKNAFNSTFGGDSDGFIAKFSPSWEPINVTYFGGSNTDSPGNVHVTSSGYLVTGDTFSNDFPKISSNYFGSSTSDPDIFLAFFDFSVNLVWTEVIGGSQYDNYHDAVHVATPFNNYTYIVGRTQSTDFPVNSSFAISDTLTGTHDGFIIRYNMFHRYYEASFYGGSGIDTIRSISSDSANNIIVAGHTDSTDFPITDGTFQTNFAGADDIFIAKMGETPTAELGIHWSTLFGEYGYENVNSVATDSKGNIIVAGTSTSHNITMENPYDDTLNDLSDIILLKFNQFGSLFMSTFVGGSQRDSLQDMVIDEQDQIVFLSNLQSYDFPLVKPYSDQPYPDGFYYLSSVISVFSAYPTDNSDYRNGDLMFSSITSDYSETSRGRLAIDENKILLTTWASDNFTTTSNANQPNLNGFSDVGIKSIYHPLLDHDEDGWSTIDEVRQLTSPVKTDTDSDGMPDGFELQHGLDPTVDDTSDDLDNDGMPNGWEYEMGLNPSDSYDATKDKDSDNLINLQEFKIGTDAQDSDTDDDGLLDGKEVHKYNTDPTTADTDGDGVDDGTEVLIDHTDPLDPNNDRNDGLNESSGDNNTSSNTKEQSNVSPTNESFLSVSFISILTGSLALATYRIRNRFT